MGKLKPLGRNGFASGVPGSQMPRNWVFPVSRTLIGVARRAIADPHRPGETPCLTKALGFVWNGISFPLVATGFITSVWLGREPAPLGKRAQGKKAKQILDQARGEYHLAGGLWAIREVYVNTHHGCQGWEELAKGLRSPQVYLFRSLKN